MGNVNMEASQINYRGGQKKMSVEEALKNTSGEAAAIAQLQTDVLNLNSNKANQITIAPFFSAEASYDPGDLVYYNGLSYRCVNAHEGEWDADDFAATTISGELDSLKSGLTVQTAYINTENAIGTAYKMGNVIFVNILNGTYFSAVAEDVLFTLPDGFRPEAETSVLNTMGSKQRITINSNGQVVAKEAFENTYLRFCVAFIKP